MELDKPVIKKRGRGIKNPPGVTQALILEYLLDKDMTPTDDIRDYLREKGVKRRIKTKNLVYGHLKTLEGNPDKEGHYRSTRYINRIPGGKGKTDYYTMRGGFESFKNIFNFMKEQHLEKCLMKSKYYQDYVNTNDFRQKFILNVFRETMLKFDKITHNDKAYERLKGRLGDAPEKIKLVRVLENTKNGNGDWAKTYHTIIDDLKCDIDDYLPIIERRYHEIDPDRDVLQFITYLGYYAIPTTDRDRIFSRLTTSPSAIDFTFNPKYYDKYILWNLLAAYTGSTILTEPKRFQETMDAKWEKDKDSTTFIKLLDFLYEDIELYEILEEAPITAILEAMMITDLINGKIIKNKDPQKTSVDHSQTNDLQQKPHKPPTKNNKLPTNNKKSSTKTRGVKE